MDKAKGGVGLRVGWERVVEGKWRQLYLDNNKKIIIINLRYQIFRSCIYKHKHKNYFPRCKQIKEGQLKAELVILINNSQIEDARDLRGIKLI